MPCYQNITYLFINHNNQYRDLKQRPDGAYYFKQNTTKQSIHSSVRRRCIRMEVQRLQYIIHRQGAVNRLNSLNTKLILYSKCGIQSSLIVPRWAIRQMDCMQLQSHFSIYDQVHGPHLYTSTTIIIIIADPNMFFLLSSKQVDTQSYPPIISFQSMI